MKNKKTFSSISNFKLKFIKKNVFILYITYFLQE